MRRASSVLVILFATLILWGCGGGSSSGGGAGSAPNVVYIDPTAATAGRGTLAEPFRSWSSVTFQAGTTYLQRRGTVAREEVVVGQSGLAQAKIVLGAYGAGADPVISGASLESGWQFEQASIYSKTLGMSQSLGLVAENGQVLRFREFDSDLTTTFTNAQPGSFAIDFDNNVVYAWCTDSASPDTHVMEVSQRLHGLTGSNVTNIEVMNLHVQYASLHGIAFNDCEDIVITNCTIEKSGGARLSSSPLLYAGNGIEFANGCQRCRVQGATVTDIFDSGFTAQTFESQVIADDIRIDGSQIARCGFAGIEIAALRNGNKVNSELRNIDVTGVSVMDCGLGWSGRRYGIEGRGIKIVADIDGLDTTRSIVGMTVQNCVISGSAGEGIFIGGRSGQIDLDRVTVQGNAEAGILVQESGDSNLLIRLTSSIIRENGVGNNQSGFVYNVPTGQGIELLHNSFFDNGFLALNVANHNGSVTTICNNVFHTTVFKTHIFYSPSPGINSSFENNCLTEFGVGQLIINIAGATFDSVVQFNAQVAASQQNIGTADPQLNSDLTILGPSSPCFGAGKSHVNVVADRAGASFRASPSIGAFEF